MTDAAVFKDDAFDLDAYLASIMSLDATTATPSARDIFATAMPLLDELESAKENLHALADATSRRLATLAREAKDEETAFLSRVDHLRDGVGGLNATLGALETRVGHVVRSTSGVGDRLRLADARRAAAEEARALATHLTAFDRAQDFQALPDVVDPLFHDPARSAEAARLAQRLLRLAHDAAAEDRAERARARAQTHPAMPIPSAPASGASAPASGPGPGPGSSSSSFASRPPRLAVAAHNLERYCDALENRLLSSFESAERARDAEGARAAARTLAQFNGGESLARRFVATRAMFMSVESLAEIETLRAAAPNYTGSDPNAPGGRLETSADADAAAESALDALRGFFARARDATRAEADKAREFFPDHRIATAPLAARVVEQRVGAAVDAVLPQAPPPPPASSAPFASVGAFGELMTPAFHRSASFGGVDALDSSSGASSPTDPNAGPGAGSVSASARSGVPGRYALLAHLKIVAGAVALARELGADLAEIVDGAVDVAAVADGLFAEHRAGYPELERACLRGLAGDASIDMETEGDGGGGGTPEAATLARLYRDAAERCAAVLAPPPPPPPPPRSTTTTEENSASAEEASVSARDVTTMRSDRPSDEEILAAGFVPPGWSLRAARTKDAKRADRNRDARGNGDGENGKNGKNGDGGVLRPDAGSIRPNDDDDDDDSPAGRAASRAARARATAAAASLAATAAAERTLAEALLDDAARLAAANLDRAVDACERASGRFTGLSSAEEIVSGGVGVVLRAVRAATADVRATRAIVDALRDARDARAAARAIVIAAGGDATASAASTAAAAAREASRATRVALEAYESATEARVVAALHRGLASLAFAVDGALRERQLRRDFAPDEDDPGSWTTFPGQERSMACAAALELASRTTAAAETHLGGGDEDASAEGGKGNGNDNDGKNVAGGNRNRHPNVRAFVNELAARLRASVEAHIARHRYTMTGALQLKRDLGEFEAWARREADSERQLAAWRRVVDLCGALIVPPAALPGLLAETREAAREEGAEEGAEDDAVADMVRVIQLRADYHPSMLSKDPSAPVVAAGKGGHSRTSSFLGFA